MHWETMFRGFHNEVSQLGLKCMLNLMHDHFLWPQKATQVKEHVDRCHQCITFKAKQQQAPLGNIVATHPLEQLHIDYLCLELEKGKEENVLVVMDNFTCYTQAYVNQSQTAQTMAKALWDKFIFHYELPLTRGEISKASL